jgi:hypothetical protein
LSLAALFLAGYLTNLDGSAVEGRVIDGILGVPGRALFDFEIRKIPVQIDGPNHIRPDAGFAGPGGPAAAMDIDLGFNGQSVMDHVGNAFHIQPPSGRVIP